MDWLHLRVERTLKTHLFGQSGDLGLGAIEKFGERRLALWEKE